MNDVTLISKIAVNIDHLTAAPALVEGIFSPLEKALASADATTKQTLIELLGKADEKVRKMTDDPQDWWRSEIYLRKARCARGLCDKKEEYSYWKQAAELAAQARHHEICVQSTLELGFSFIEFTSSLREILELQMRCVRAICDGGVAVTSRLRIIGVNLFDFWRQLEYRRLSEHDLKAKQYMLDGAKHLEKAGFDDDSAAPLMILLISKLYDFDAPDVEWARQEAAILHLPIPAEVKEKIDP